MEDAMRCDLHVHSLCSGPVDLPVLGRFGNECYSTPREVYDVARARHVTRHAHGPRFDRGRPEPRAVSGLLRERGGDLLSARRAPDSPRRLRNRRDPALCDSVPTAGCRGALCLSRGVAHSGRHQPSVLGAQRVRVAAADSRHPRKAPHTTRKVVGALGHHAVTGLDQRESLEREPKVGHSTAWELRRAASSCSQPLCSCH